MMKKPLFLLSLVVTAFFSYAQMEVVKENSWTVKWNNKVLLTATTEDEDANVVKIAKSDLGKKYNLEITYSEADPVRKKTWDRYFMFVDKNDRELFRKDKASSITVTAAQLKKIFGNKKKVRVYTVSLPSDPEQAARVRVRRVLLCSLELQ